MTIVKEIELNEKLTHAIKVSQYFEEQVNEIKKDDFSGRFYVSSTLEIFKKSQYWKKEIEKIKHEIGLSKN